MTLSSFLHDLERWPATVRFDDAEVLAMQWSPDDEVVAMAVIGWLSGSGIGYQPIAGPGGSENLLVGGREANPGDWVLFDVDLRRVTVVTRRRFYEAAMAADPANSRPRQERILLRLAGEWEAEADRREAYANSDDPDDEDGPDELAMGVELNLAELLRRNAAALRQIAGS